MARHTIASALRKYRSDYKRLMAYEARLNHVLFLMKQRMKKIAADQQKWTGRQQVLARNLQQLQQQKAALETHSLPATIRRVQLEKIEKQILVLKAQVTANEWHLAVLERNKLKDNAAKLVLKDAKRDQVQARATAAKVAWDRLEQIQQWECASVEAFAFQRQEQKTLVLEKMSYLIHCSDSQPSWSTVLQDRNRIFTQIQSEEINRCFKWMSA